MLREIAAKSDRSEGIRRWFEDDYFHLIIWLDATARPLGFQLCYDVGRNEHAVTWTLANGIGHRRVDDGPTGRLTPFLVPDGVFPAEEILSRFKRSAVGLPEEFERLVVERLGTWMRDPGATVPADAAKGPPRG